MKNLLLSTMFAAATMMLAPPAMAGDALQQAKDSSVQDASSRHRNKARRSRGARQSARGDRHHQGASHHTSSRNRSSGYSTHHVVHHTGGSHHRVVVHDSHRRYHGPVYVGPRVVLRTRYSRVRHVVHTPPPVVVQETRYVDEPVAEARPAGKARRFSIGVGAGVASSRLYNGAPYTNVGVDGQARYRIADPIGVELTLGYYGDFSRDMQRTDVPFTASLMLHTPGYVPIGAFAYAGVTLDYRDYDLTRVGGDHLRGGLAGPHVGAGININLGPSATLEWDVRYTHFLTETGFHDGGTAPGQFGSQLAVNFFF